MLRVAISRISPAHTTRRQRNFVSSVLLTRTWENETVAKLKKEAKIRGLSPKGNKASLILQLQEHDKIKTLDAISSQNTAIPVGARKMSTSPSTSGEGVTPGIPPASQPTRPPPEVFMNTNIPDLSRPDPEPLVQIPYVPDFWDSSVQVQKPNVEEPLPKLLVVAGAETHPGGGPSHNLHDEHALTEFHTPVSISEAPAGQGGLLSDIVEDLGLPPVGQIKQAFWKIFS